MPSLIFMSARTNVSFGPCRISHDVEHAVGVAGTGGDLHPGAEVRDVGDHDRVAAEFEPVLPPVRARRLDRNVVGFQPISALSAAML